MGVSFTMTQKPEIMAPAGSFEVLAAGIQAGADSIYFGVEQLNMRARAATFTLEDLPTVVETCKKSNVKCYLTLNTIVYDHDMPLLKKVCDAAKAAGVSAVIASDLAAIQYARSIGLSVHASTQLNISNIDAVKFFAPFVDVVVLARELTLQQVKHIIDTISKEDIRGPSGNLVEIELFCHGALCVAVSGKCYMSLATYNASANRGACLQNCRRSYKVTDNETGDELVIDNNYVMSPKDLCTIGFLDQLIDAGVSVLKIEGRARAADYVFVTTKAYREAVDAVANGTYTKEKIDVWMQQLQTVYNRGFWEGGYYLGKKLGEWSASYGSKASTQKKYVGKVMNYYPKIQVAVIHLEAGAIAKGADMMIIGPTTGVMPLKAEAMQDDAGAMVEAGRKGLQITIKVPAIARKNDKVYVVEAA